VDIIRFKDFANSVGKLVTRPRNPIYDSTEVVKLIILLLQKPTFKNTNPLRNYLIDVVTKRRFRLLEVS